MVEERRERVRRSDGRYSGPRVNSEQVRVLPTWIVRLFLDDPRKAPYLMVWTSRRDGRVTVMSAGWSTLRTAWITACRRLRRNGTPKASSRIGLRRGSPATPVGVRARSRTGWRNISRSAWRRGALGSMNLLRQWLSVPSRAIPRWRRKYGRPWRDRFERRSRKSSRVAAA
jgi:hypothetical protein